MAVKNRKCLLCGESYHNCGSCSMPEWAWTYCTEECWSSSQKALMCVALGDKLVSLLEKRELVLLKQGIEEESHYLDKVLEGMQLPRD